MPDWTRFPAWKRYLAEEGGSASPFEKKRIVSTTTFLYCEMDRSGDGPLGLWFAYPGVQELVSHLRFALLTDFFGEWLGRNEWAKGKQFDLEGLFAAARRASSLYVTDIPTMEPIAAMLGEASAVPEEAATGLLEKAVRSFNRRFQHNSYRTCHLRLFKSIDRVATDIAKRNVRDGFDPKRFKELAGRALTSPAAEKEFRRTLIEAQVV